MRPRCRSWAIGALCVTVCGAGPAPAEPIPPRTGEFVMRDFGFESGERLAELRLHYLTLGQPVRDRAGMITNAVLILHGTGGSGHQFLVPQFAGVLFGPGAPLDTLRYYVVLPDGIGHGASSKPSDGLHARFPHYDYGDMITAEHRLVTERLGIRHLRLVMGTSMGGMHTWLWGERYPDMMDALMPLACLPVRIAGRNRLWRAMLMDAIRNDPEWKEGEYTTEPRSGLRTAIDLLLIAGGAPLPMQRWATPDSVDAYLDLTMKSRLVALDANDLLYQVNASRDYDPSTELDRIKAPVMLVNSADDFINPPELGIAQREIKRVRHGRFVLIPASDRTHGHGTHTWAAFWQRYLDELLKSTARR